MPIIPITIQDHKLWVYVDSGATFSMVGAAEAGDMGINWQSGRRQMVVVGDGSYIPTFIHEIPIQLGASQITVPIGFSERLGVGFNLLGRTGVFDQFEVCFNDRARKVTFQQLSPDIV
jgi:TPP-dependent trihydroxycyclohexane-1,2-dione (THcHDO) dehydratase